MKKKEIEPFSEEKIKIHQDLNTNFEALVEMGKVNDSSFLAKFGKVYPQLYYKLNRLENNLTDSELKLLALIWMKFSTKEIAQFTFVQHKTVQIKKYRLRKKLSLPKGADLYKWMDDL